MSRRRRLWWLTLGAGIVCGLPMVAAAAPWDTLMTNNRVDADPEKSYAVTERNGPWMVMACSFSGKDGPRQAQELVLELRKRYKLPAYTYERKFDLSQDLPTRLDKYGNPKKMEYYNHRKTSEIDEIAVMVGDYPAIDDPQAQETLRKIRYYQPDCLKLEKGQSTARTLAAWRTIQTAIFKPANETGERGPMGFAMLTTNPAMPKDAFVPKGVDELVLKSNEGVDHCLLDCPGKFSVQIAVFTGRVVVDQKEINLINNKGKEIDGQLAGAALEAHALTEALRLKGYEAYEFHDRYASIVTVGSFQSEGSMGADNRVQLDPQIQAVIDQFKAKKINPNDPRSISTPQKILGITLDAQPLLVFVPKRSTDSLLRRESTKVTKLP
jgi:hypothetical protein